MPVIGAGGGLLFGVKTVRPRPFGIPTFGGRTVKAGAGGLLFGVKTVRPRLFWIPTFVGRTGGEAGRTVAGGWGDGGGTVT